jgi:hypothetical protein
MKKDMETNGKYQHDFNNIVSVIIIVFERTWGKYSNHNTNKSMEIDSIKNITDQINKVFSLQKEYM